MKRFSFTLQRMLGFKQTLYKEERNKLAQLRAERLRLEMRRDDTEKQLYERDEEFRKKAAEKGVRIDEVTSMTFYRESADVLIDELDEAIAQKDVEIEKQLEIVVALDKEVKSLEKLREHQWEEYQAETNREETERILEMVSQRFVDAQREDAEEEEKAQKAQ